MARGVHLFAILGPNKLQKSELQKRKNLSCTLTNENGLLRLLHQIEVAERSWATAKLPLIESKGTLKLRGEKMDLGSLVRGS